MDGSDHLPLLQVTCNAKNCSLVPTKLVAAFHSIDLLESKERKTPFLIISNHLHRYPIPWSLNFTLLSLFAIAIYSINFTILSGGVRLLSFDSTPCQFIHQALRLVQANYLCHTAFSLPRLDSSVPCCNSFPSYINQLPSDSLPLGYFSAAPGRMLAIFTAAVLNWSKKAGEVERISVMSFFDRRIWSTSWTSWPTSWWRVESTTEKPPSFAEIRAPLYRQKWQGNLY